MYSSYFTQHVFASFLVCIQFYCEPLVLPCYWSFSFFNWGCPGICPDLGLNNRLHFAPSFTVIWDTLWTSLTPGCLYLKISKRVSLWGQGPQGRLETSVPTKNVHHTEMPIQSSLFGFHLHLITSVKGVENLAGTVLHIEICMRKKTRSDQV